MVVVETSPQATRWQYGGGIGVALFMVTIIGLLHQSLDNAGATRVNVIVRAVLRFAVSALFVLLPLIKNITNLAFLGIYVGVFSLMVVFEIWAKLGRVEVETEDHRIVDADREDELEVRAHEMVGRRLRFEEDHRAQSACASDKGGDDDDDGGGDLLADDDELAVAAQAGVPVAAVTSRDSTRAMVDTTDASSSKDGSSVDRILVPQV